VRKLVAWSSRAGGGKAGEGMAGSVLALEALAGGGKR